MITNHKSINTNTKKTLSDDVNKTWRCTVGILLTVLLLLRSYKEKKKEKKKTLKTATKKSSITILLAILLRLWLSVLLAVLCKQNHDFLNEKRKKEKEKDEEISYAAEDTVERDILAEDILAEDILVLRKGNNEKKVTRNVEKRTNKSYEDTVEVAL